MLETTRFNWHLWEYLVIPWDYLDNQWWTLPIESLIVLYCFIGFHVISDERLLPSLDAFCRKWNISHQTAQPTIYALGAVAPIIIFSNLSFISDILNQTENAHRLGICSIIGFGAATASLIPSFSVFSLIGSIPLPKNSTIRDQLFIMILVSIFLTITILGDLKWWQTCIIAGVYLTYLLSIIIYPKCKQLFHTPNPLESGNRLLDQLQDTSATAHAASYFRSTLYTEQSYMFEQEEQQDNDRHTSPFDAKQFLSSKPPLSINVPIMNNTTMDLNESSSLLGNNLNSSMMTDNNDSEYYQHRLSLGSNMTSPNKSMRSFTSLHTNNSIGSLRHPMLMNEYDRDFPVTGDEDYHAFMSDIQEFENESYSPSKKTPRGGNKKFEDDNVTENDLLNKIILHTPELQSSTYHIHPTIKFTSLNQQQSFNPDPSHKSSMLTVTPRNSETLCCCQDCVWRRFLWKIWKALKVIYGVMSFPVRCLMRITIPGSEPHNKCECLYPLAFILSMVWIVIFSVVLLSITFHWSDLYEFKLSIMGIIYIGPIATFGNVIDCVTLSLQGFASEIITNSYHIQISNIFLGITVPMIIASLPMINAVTSVSEYVKDSLFLYMEVLLIQSLVLFFPLICGANEIQLTRAKGWIYIIIYILGLIGFYYFAAFRESFEW